MTDNRNIDLVPLLAVCKPDWHLAMKWLAWARVLGWPEGVPLVVLASTELSPEQVGALQTAAEMVMPDAVVYQDVAIKELGYFGTPNQMIKSALEYVERVHPGCALLWMEADTVLIGPYWYEHISSEYEECIQPFMGDVVRAKIDHLTGNAVYHPDWRKLAPSLAALPGPIIEQGWDSQCAHEILPQAHFCKTIQQVWRPPPITREWALRNIRPECALFHQCKDGTLIDVLCDDRSVKRIPLATALCESTYPKSYLPAGTMPRTEILIVTYAKDMEFLRYCLASIRRYASGFSGTTLLVPSHEKGLYDWVKRDATVRYFDEPAGKGMMAAQIQKLRADQHCPNAEVILTMDADCMFFRRVTPSDYVNDGKCMMVREAYSVISNPNRHIWKDCVKKAIGWEPQWETMVRHPQVHPRHSYQLVRDAVEKHTGQAFDDYVLSCRNEFPQGFAEWPTLGAVGISQAGGVYWFVDYDHRADADICGQNEGSFQYLYRRDRDFCVEWWSHGGIGTYKSDCEAVLAGCIPEYWIK